MKAKITRKTTSEMVSPHCDNTESTTTTTKGRRRKTWEKETKLKERTEKEKRKSLQIYRDELFQFPSLCFGLLCSSSKQARNVGMS